VKKEDQFFVTVLVTILIIRAGLWIAGTLAENPDALGLTIFGLRLHHWMYGLVLLLVGILIKNLIVIGAGTGLFLDELTYILIGGSTHADNYSWISLAGTAVVLMVIFYFRKLILQLIEKYGPVGSRTRI